MRRPALSWPQAGAWTLALVSGLSPAAPARPVTPAIAEPTLALEVSPKDTLIGLSQRLLTSPAAWPEVARLNRLPNPNRIQPGQTLLIPLRLLKSTDTPAQLLSVEGEVLLDGQAARAGQAVQPGQLLATGPQGSALVLMGDGSRLQLVPGSQARLAEHRRYGPEATTAEAPATTAQTAGQWFATAMRLVSGSVEVLASKVLRAKPLEVQTPTAVIGVRGTEYRVHYEPVSDNSAPSTQAEVLEGRVSAEPARMRDAATLLAAGQGAAINADRAPQVAPLLPAPDLTTLPARFERPLVRLTVPPAADTPSALRWQVAADERFERLVRDERTAPGAEIRIAGLDDGRWFLRVRRVDALGIEGLNATQPFTLKARPEPPAAAAPRPGAKLPVGPVTLAWAENVEADHYRLQWSRDPSFNTEVGTLDEVRGASASISPTEPGSYHWRSASVKADGDIGPWGDARSFELRPLPTPPQGGLNADGSGLTLNWTGRPDDLQQVELARDEAFGQVVARADLKEAQWTLPLPEQPGTYYFRYRTVEPDGFVSPWSSTLKVEVPRDWRFLWLVLPLVFAL